MSSSWIESQFKRTVADKTAAMTSSSARTLFDVDFCALDQSVLAENEDMFGVALLPQLRAPGDGKCFRVFSIRIAKLLAHKSKSSLSKSVRKNLGLKRSRDLVHSICALYDNCLPELGVSNIYDSICDHKALTIFVVEVSTVAACEVENENTFLKGTAATDDEDEETKSSVYGESDCLEEAEKTVPDAASVFKELFTDQSDDDEEDEDEEEEDDDGEDNTQGVQSFISNIKEKTDSNSLAFLKSLVACCTIRKVSTFSLSNRIETIVDLELLCVRKKYRRQRIGRYLIDLIKNRYCVGLYDAIVTSSDFDAIKFYESVDFSLDPILNSKYGSVGDVWTNTTRMCYLPPYLSASSPTTDVFTEMSYFTEIEAMEKDFADWQKNVFNLYQSQVQLFMKLKKDVVKTKATLLVKDKMIEELKLENDLLKRKMKFLELKEKLLIENDDQSTSVNET